MDRQRFRVFVSSPGDVTAAREVAAQIIEKLAHEYARFFIIEPYLWEYEPMLASGHFQDSIDPPSRFDAVILILESRLGTPLPERTAVREYRGMDGRAPVTGTEWEFEDALSGARAHGVPDLLVYRSRRPAEIDTWDLRSREAVLKQIEALDAFWSRHFAHEGRFIGAYAKFKTLEELAGKLEQHLRGCVQRRLEKLTPEERPTAVRLWPTAPFRGLEAYEFEHAPIFFGREEAIGTALLRLIGNAQIGRPFLLVMGASGSGKSSLVKAGLLPRLLVPQRVSGIAFLRRATFRPGDAHGDEDLFDALARRLISGDRESAGLPELAGTSTGAKDLAEHLRESSIHPEMPFAMVLDRLAETARAGGKILRYEQARVILEVDQLEELFTSERVRLEERKAFVQLLAALVRSGLVWLIATMRADFWHRASDIPELLELADGHGRLDLRPPSSSELSQMIRAPAEAAAIHFEAHAATGIPLNDLIAQEAAGEPGALPLLSYLLDQLYQSDIQEGGGDTLTYASYNALGGLKGAIATRADAVIAAQPPEVQQALRPVLFALVQMSAGEGGVERAVARRAPLTDFPQGTPKRRLIEALLDASARLLVADAVSGRESTVRLAHEALISEWTAARNYVAGNAEALKTRGTLEERYARWQAISSERDITTGDPRTRHRAPVSSLRRRFAAEQGLLTDVDLLDARKLVQNYRDELSPGLLAYVERSTAQSRRRRQRAFRITLAAAVVLGVLAIAAGYEAKLASAQRQVALQAQQHSLTQTAAARLHAADVASASAIILDVLATGNNTGRHAPDALGVFEEVRAADRRVIAINGHKTRVDWAVFSPDGRHIATASWDGTARIWSASGGQQEELLSGHKAQVVSVSFSHDGRRLVTASFDGTARIWDVASARSLRVLSGHAGRLYSASFSPNDTRIVTASLDETARVWDVQTGKTVLVLRGHTDRVQSAAFSPDGLRIVTASLDNTARIWDARSGRQLLVIPVHGSSVESAEFSPDGKRVLTASFDKTASLWDATDGHELLTLRGHSAVVYNATFSLDGQRIVTSSMDNTARIWDATNGAQLAVLMANSSPVSHAAFSPDGTRIVTTSFDSTVMVWEAVARRRLLSLTGHAKTLNSAAFSPNGREIVTTAFDKTARVWDAATGRQRLIFRGTTDCFDAVFSPDGTLIITTWFDKTARIWDAATGRETMVLTGHTDAVEGAAFAPDGRQVITTSLDQTARSWDVASGKPILVLNGRGGTVTDAAYSPDGNRILTSLADGTVHIWDTGTGLGLLVLRGHGGAVLSAAYSPNGRMIATGSVDGNVRVWDARTGAQAALLSGHRGPVAKVRFSPDGSRLLSASFDGTVRVWGAADDLPILVVQEDDLVQSAEFAPDGKSIVTVTLGNVAHVWDIRSPELGVQIASADAAQFDSLSSSERSQLGLPPPTDVRRFPDAKSNCDQSAAALYDPDRHAPGVALENLAIDVALPACAQDRASSKGSVRVLYEHGRALMAMGSLPAARQDFERALGAGYSAAAVDLGMLLSQPSAGMLDVPRAISLYGEAWKDGVTIAAFQLGSLYEHGVRQVGSQSGYLLAPDEAKAWGWYQQGADAGEPNALARFGEKEDHAALGAESAPQRNSDLLRAFEYYAAASERARLEDWPDDAWRNWRYRRASLARILARQGMMADVAREYSSILKRYAPRATLWQRLETLAGFE